MLVDDGGDATLLIHEGVKAEKAFAENGTLPDPSSTEDPEFKIVLKLLKNTLTIDPKKWTKMAAKIVGVSEETTTGVHRLYQVKKQTAFSTFSCTRSNCCVQILPSQCPTPTCRWQMAAAVASGASCSRRPF